MRDVCSTKLLSAPIVLGGPGTVVHNDAATLMAIISAHVAPGTEIWSDQWASYHNVGRIPGVTAHHTANRLSLVRSSIDLITLLSVYFSKWSTYKHC